jgi:hypothetical protein
LSGISEHNGVLLEVEWGEICRESKVERIVPVYHKTDVSGITDGSNYVVKRDKVSFQKCRDKCFRKEAVHIWYDRQLISGE